MLKAIFIEGKMNFSLTNTWMNNPTFLAQTAHFFGAVSVIMISNHFWDAKGMWIVASIFVVLAFIKEFWYDLTFELPKQTLIDSVLDFTFYILGIVSAIGLVFIK